MLPKYLLIPALVLHGLLVEFAGAQTTRPAEPRGIWWWADSPWGTEQVVGDSAKEDAAMKFTQAWNINRLYCSYTKAIKDRPQSVRSWNQRLHTAGKSPQLLLSGKF